MPARATTPDRLRSQRTGITDPAAEWQDWEYAAPDDWDTAEASGWEPVEPFGWEPEEAHGADGWFAYGGLADGLRPGSLLAGLAEDAWTAGLDRLADDELIGVMRAARRLASWAGALEVAAAGDLWRRRWAEEQAGATGAARHVDDEIAAALTLTGRAADQLLNLAVALSRLPLTSGALAAADIDMPRAMVIADEVTALDHKHAAAVEQRIIGTAPVQTTGQLRAATRRAVMAADPTAARRRKERALQDARVERWDEHAGTAALAGRDLPPASVLAADQNLSALARQLQAAGAAGTLDHLRAQIYLALLTGVPVKSLLPVRCSATEGSAGPADCAAWLERREPGTAGGASGSAASGCGDDPAHTGRTGTTSQYYGLTGSVNLTMPLATWLGLSDAPGYAAGSGPLDADDSRALAELLADRADSKWCLTFTDSDGRPVAHGCARAGPPPGPHHAEWPTGPPGGPATASRVTTSRATASSASSSCAGPATASRNGPGTGERGGPGGPEPGRTWTFSITLLADGDCDHARQTAAYRPSAGLRHLVEVRHVTCTYPGCRRPAARCDADHTVAYHRGGRTCLCNLAPLCRRHHQAKQAHGWALEQTRPGVMTWITPAGRRYTVTPTSYPS